ncbi:DnaJ subfamily C member 3 [Intoshia linei]|uniref:DnaJ subfamily C member 3 n=1 Tax=Intoshia linei TaxID=1819745 RepID=A0A177AUR2_9BILA|nr:DnaJ subfamily C member 3 [Intoshia linei]
MHIYQYTQLLISFILIFKVISRSTEIENLLKYGKNLLSQGKYNEALQKFDKAATMDADPIIRYHRSTVFYAQSLFGRAIEDLNYVIEKLPKFYQARIQRANIQFKKGNYEASFEDSKFVCTVDPSNSQCNEIKQNSESNILNLEKATMFFEEEEYFHCISILDELIKESPWSIHMRNMRADSLIATRQESIAIKDLKSLVNLIPDNRETLLKMSLMQYQLGDSVASLDSVRDCIRLDQEDKPCRKHYSKIKKMAKEFSKILDSIESKKWQICLDKCIVIKEKLSTHPSIYKFKINRLICNCQAKSGNAADAVKTCSKLIENDKNDIESLIDRAEAYEQLDKYDNAINDYRTAKEINSSFLNFDAKIKNLQRSQKMASKRDYYKILGVNRNADEEQINKAYRKLARQWHPDRFKEDEEKEAAKKKFIDIADAKHVLTDKKLRNQFDGGHDPLDPEMSQGGGHGFNQGFNPFNQGFNPFESEGYSFNFNF